MLPVRVVCSISTVQHTVAPSVKICAWTQPYAAVQGFPVFCIFSITRSWSNKYWEAKAYVQTEPKMIRWIIHPASGWWRAEGENLLFSQRLAGVMLQHCYEPPAYRLRLAAGLYRIYMWNNQHHWFRPAKSCVRASPYDWSYYLDSKHEQKSRHIGSSQTALSSLEIVSLNFVFILQVQW
jgi:hypothetical protein